MITAVDVGATKVLVAQFGADGLLRHESRFPTPVHPHEFLSQLYDYLENLDYTNTIIVGVPGLVSEEGVLLRCGNLPWKNIALRQLLEDRFKVPVRVENDAKLAALAEISRLSPVPQVGLYITVSTGIGGGVIVNGHLPTALRNSEPGHMRLQFNGQWQQWQQFASGKALTQHFGKEAHEFTRDNEWREVADRLSRGLFALIPTLQPDVIIFGGGVGNYCEHFDDLLQEKLIALQPYIDIPKIRKAAHANEAVLYGCYTYATTQHDV